MAEVMYEFGGKTIKYRCTPKEADVFVEYIRKLGLNLVSYRLCLM